MEAAERWEKLWNAKLLHVYLAQLFVSVLQKLMCWARRKTQLSSANCYLIFMQSSEHQLFALPFKRLAHLISCCMELLFKEFCLSTRKFSSTRKWSCWCSCVWFFFCIFVRFHFNFIKTPKKAELRVFHMKLILHLNCMQFIFIRGIRNYQIAHSEAWNFWNFLNSPPFSFCHCRLLCVGCVGWEEIGKQGKRHGRSVGERRRDFD